MLMRFAPDERRLLLSVRGIGPTVVRRLEAQGIASLQDLRHRGVDRVVDGVCAQVGTRAWANRRSALIAALRGPGAVEGRAAPPWIAS
jgi:hypothetical protein